MEARILQLPVSKDAVPGVLQAYGILPTTQRAEIAALLLSAPHHWSAEQVLVKLNESSAAVSKATVYNTLGLFADRGLIREVIVDPTKTFYDSNTAPHYHFYNVDDGVLTDVDADQIPLENLPQAPGGAHTEGVDIVIRISNRQDSLRPTSS